MRKAVVLALVLVVVLTGLPVLMGMGMTACKDCGPAMTNGGCQAALLVGLSLVVALLVGRLRTGRVGAAGVLLFLTLDRPPRWA